MRLLINKVRELQIIEKEISGSALGIAAFLDKEEEISQSIVPFIYLDKNIYFFIIDQEVDEENVVIESKISFTIKSDRKADKNKEHETKLKNKYFFVKINGIIRTIDDPKVYESLIKLFQKKYNRSEVESDLFNSIDLNKVKILMIDTVEIDAMEILSD